MSCPSFVHRLYPPTAIDVQCNCSLHLRQKDLFQCLQRYNISNVPLLTYHTYSDYNNAKLYIYIYIYIYIMVFVRKK